MFEVAGFNYKIGKFNAMYNRAKELVEEPDASDMVSLRHFQHAISELHKLD